MLSPPEIGTLLSTKVFTDVNAISSINSKSICQILFDIVKHGRHVWWKVTNLRWISLWCRQFGVNFGDLFL